MKYRNLRELVPILAVAAIVSAGYFHENVLADCDEQNDDYIEPKYLNSESFLGNNELIILNLSDSDLSNYDTINSNQVKSIIYSENKEYITVYLKNSDIYYTGYYNIFYQKYIYTRNNDKIKEYVKK